MAVVVVSALLVVVVASVDVVDIAATVGFGRSSAIVTSILAGAYESALD